MKFNFYQAQRQLQRQQQLEQQQLQQQFSQAIPVQLQQEGEGEGGEGAPPTAEAPSELDKVMGALKKERELNGATQKELKALKAQLEAFSGVDPELAKKAQAILQQQEEWSQRESKMRDELEQTYQPKLSELEKRAIAAEQGLQNYKRDVVLEREFHKAGGFQGEFEAIAHALQPYVRFNPKGELEVVGKDGQREFHKGEPMTIAQKIEQIKADQIWFARHFKAAEGSGAGLSGNGRGGAIDPSLSGLPAWEQVARMRAQKG